VLNCCKDMEELSLKVKQKRGGRGIREVAAEIGVSHMTLSRVEAGKQPDIRTFAKICKWLDLDPNVVLGIRMNQPAPTAIGMPQAHFRADKTMSPTTAQHLAELILAVNRSSESE